MPSFKRFIHFGCWNNSGCDYDKLDADVNPSDTALARVMKKIKKNVDTSKYKPEFITVAGDNYYPIIKKDKATKIKTKILDEKDLISGFMCLPEDIKKYLLLGNHDLEALSNSTSNPVSVCQILDMQKDIEADPTNNFEMDNLKDNYILHAQLSESTIIIMLDTSMYSNEDKNLKKVETCYQRLFKIHNLDNPNKDTIKNVRELQKKRVESFIDEKLLPKLEKIKNIIVIGHHPLICFKTDETKDTITGLKTPETETLAWNELNKLYFDSIYGKLKKNKHINYFYLCADLHQYQVGDVIITNNSNSRDQMSIKQYVVGTGGSRLEDMEVDLSLVQRGNDSSVLDTVTITYTNVSNIPAYGFLDCILTHEGEFNPVFIPADMTGFEIKTFKGGYSKKKYKRKSHKKTHKKIHKKTHIKTHIKTHKKTHKKKYKRRCGKKTFTKHLI